MEAAAFKFHRTGPGEAGAPMPKGSNGVSICPLCLANRKSPQTSQFARVWAGNRPICMVPVLEGEKQDPSTCLTQIQSSRNQGSVAGRPSRLLHKPHRTGRGWGTEKRSCPEMQKSWNCASLLVLASPGLTRTAAEEGLLPVEVGKTQLSFITNTTQTVGV